MRFSVDELKAMEQSLPGLGGYLAEKGLVEKPFAAMEREEILGLIANTLRIWREQFEEVTDIPF